MSEDTGGMSFDDETDEPLLVVEEEVVADANAMHAAATTTATRRRNDRGFFIAMQRGREFRETPLGCVHIYAAETVCVSINR